MERLGRYEVLYKLGSGAMGTVYRGRDPKIDRVVALKTINIAGLGPAEVNDYRERFFREAQAAGRLSHSSIVTVYDVGEEETTQTPYLVMEFIGGMTLEELGRGERLPREKALELVQQVADALDYAHAQKIVHRDIKPANIIVAQDGRAKITDFGIAKLQATQFTRTGTVMGTPAFMSPEQLTAAPVDGRADLFSLGTVLYWLLIGRQPFSGDSLAALSYSVVHTQPSPPSHLEATLTADYDYVLQRALAKDPAQRYQRGRELAEDLEDLKCGRPPRSRTAVAAAVTETPPLTRTVALDAVAPPRKRRWLVPVGVAALLLLLLLLGAGWWWWNGRSAAPEVASEPTATQAMAQPPPQPVSAPPASPTTGPTRPRPPALATVRLQGEHDLEEGTLYLYADDKLVDQVALGSNGVISGSLRLSADTRAVTVRVRGPAATSPAWVPPGLRKKRKASASITFDQKRTLRASLQPAQARTLFVRADQNRGLTVRWSD